MKKNLSLVLALVLTLTLLLTGCGCKHEWKDATCTAPKTCNLCGETEGEALPHTWVDANCETAKTCSECGATEGDALGHTWVDATCDTPKTCSVCQKTEGEPAEHKWEDATTEAPKTCSACQKTEGEKINTDSRFKTANCKEFFGEWKGVIKVSGSVLVDPGFTGVLEVEYTMIFHNDGTFEEACNVLNEEAFKNQAKTYCTSATYKLYLDQYGWSASKTDEAYEDYYGVDVKEYWKMRFAGIDYQGIYSAGATGGVYYVANEKIHYAKTWSNSMTSETYTITDQTLVTEFIKADDPDAVLYRVEVSV